jgi:phosphoglucosamine mutase
VSKLFGTDGIRGPAGEPPLDESTVYRLGLALGEALSTDLHHPARFVVGRDTRESGPVLLRALAAGLTEAGALVRSAGVVPTPGVSFLARSEDFDAGVVLSASHNPWQDNGLKIFSHAGVKLRDELERRVEDAFAQTEGRCLPESEAPTDETPLRQAYADWLLERGRAAGLDLAGRRIAIDSANGAAAPLSVPLLKALGAEVVSRGDAPDGRNINAGCGSLHPEGLAELVRESGAEMGIALDGDADRALLVDAQGREVDGDDILLIAADWLSSQDRLRGPAIVGTIMSNFGLERALGERGLQLKRSRVGDRFVLEMMQTSGCNLGGEPSGHVIFLDEAPTGDGLLTALQVLAAMVGSGRPLHELSDALERTPQILKNVVVRDRVPLDSVEGWDTLAQDWLVRFGDDGRFVVRYSGTEPLVRVMAEGTDAELVAACVDDLAGHLERALGGA